MADLSTNIPQISFGQADKETTVNELFDAASPAMLFGRNGVTSAGLDFGLLGGRLNGLPFANVVITLPDNATIYLSIDLATGVFSSESGGFKAGETPLYKLTTSGGLVTNYEDHRQMLGGGAADPLVMADILDKQGKVLDDLTPLPVEDVDSAVEPKGYLVSDAGGYLDGAQLFVQQTPEGLVTQTIHLPILGKSGFRTKPVGGAWSDLSFTIAPSDILYWHSNTTAEAPNAVINADGTFSRSLATYNPNPLLEVSGASHAFVKADANKYARYTSTGAKTATFDSGEGFIAGDAFHITNRAASGNITISGTGVTFNTPKNGTLVLEPKDTVTVKFISPTEADVMGSTGAA